MVILLDAALTGVGDSVATTPTTNAAVSGTANAIATIRPTRRSSAPTSLSTP